MGEWLGELALERWLGELAVRGWLRHLWWNPYDLRALGDREKTKNILI